MRRKKNFTKAVGTYFFDIKMSFNNTITISRTTRKEAEYAFSNYLKQKKQCDWLGQWDGKKFIDTEYKNAA